MQGEEKKYRPNDLDKAFYRNKASLPAISGTEQIKGDQWIEIETMKDQMK